MASTLFITNRARARQKTRVWLLLHSTVQARHFEALPPHFIHWHPLPTQHSPRQLRRISFFSCRVARPLASSSLHSASSLGEHTPGLPTRSRRRHVPLYTAVTAMAPTSPRPSARANEGSRPSLHHGLGLGPTLVTSLGPRAGTGLPSPPAAARLLAHPAPATGPAWLQRIPPGPRVHTVRLPRGTGHGKGPCPAQARIGFPKSSWSRPPKGVDRLPVTAGRPQGPA